MTQIFEYWKNLSIRIKLLTYFFVILLFVSIFNVYLNNNNQEVMEQFNQTMTDYYDINRLLVLTESNADYIDRYLNELNIEDKDGYTETKAKIESLVQSMFMRFSGKEIYFTLTAIKNSTESYFFNWESAIHDRENNIDSYYFSYYDGLKIEEYVEVYIQDLLYLSLEDGAELYNALDKQAKTLGRISLFMIFAVFVFALIIGGLFVNAIVRPIRKLANASLEISAGNLDVEIIDIVSNDEIGVLSESFNKMSQSIREYVNDLEQKVIIEKKLHEEELELVRLEQLVNEAQFQALQSQINPHFLFNTLNTISRTAMFEEAESTVKLTEALSNLFRYKLQKVSAVIPIKEELYIIQEYIYLQKVRFKERLKFVIDLEEGCEGASIPAFTFQPIVENAIIHGIEPKIEGGVVRIKIRFFNKKGYKKIRVSIIDTGIGMSRDKLDAVRGFNTQGNKSIGVGNVYHRFMIGSNQKAHMSIMSKLDFGTCVRFEFGTEDFNE